MVDRKHTLAAPAHFSGVGAHTGRFVRAAIKPSDAGRVFFRRSDLGGLVIGLDPARAESPNCTVLRGEGGAVRTVEHLLAALLMSGVDSAEVELDGEEIPILDGSAAPIVELLRRTGKLELAAERTVLTVREPLILSDGQASIRFEPADGLEVSYLIDYEHPAISRQELSLALDEETFRTGVAPARTFGFQKDAEKLKARGLALGSSLENAVVLDDTGVVNPPLRFPDEFVRHKILDLAGDLALLGAPLRARVAARRAGHGLHQRAVRELSRIVVESV